MNIVQVYSKYFKVVCCIYFIKLYTVLTIPTLPRVGLKL